MRPTKVGSPKHLGLGSNAGCKNLIPTDRPGIPNQLHGKRAEDFRSTASAVMPWSAHVTRCGGFQGSSGRSADTWEWWSKVKICENMSRGFDWHVASHWVYRHLFHCYFDVYKYLHMHMSFILAGALSRQTLKDSLEFRNLKSIPPVLHWRFIKWPWFKISQNQGIREAIDLVAFALHNQPVFGSSIWKWG